MLHKSLGSRIRSGFVQWVHAFPFIVGGLLLMSIFVLYPLFRNVYISFTEYDVINNQAIQVIGFENYVRCFRDPQYHIALRNTLFYTLITVPGQMFFGLILACLIHAINKGKTLFRIICYLPVITSWVVVSLIFKYLFMSGKAGFVNYTLMQLGVLEKPVAWLQNEWTANVVLWLFGIWKGVGWVMVIYLAALQNIPTSVYEASEIDGAGPIRRFFSMTIPMVKNTTNYLLVVLTIGGFGAYIHVMMITEGAPLGTTNQLINYMYNSAFSVYDFGYAAAQAVVIGLIVFVLTLVQRRVSRDQKN